MNKKKFISEHAHKSKREHLDEPNFCPSGPDAAEDAAKFPECGINHHQSDSTSHFSIANGISAKAERRSGPADPFAVATQCKKIVILRLKELKARIGLGRSAIYYLMDPTSPHYAPDFPRSVKISAHCVGWIEYEIEEFLRSRVSASRS